MARQRDEQRERAAAQDAGRAKAGQAEDPSRQGAREGGTPREPRPAHQHDQGDDGGGGGWDAMEVTGPGGGPVVIRMEDAGGGGYEGRGSARVVSDYLSPGLRDFLEGGDAPPWDALVGELLELPEWAAPIVLRLLELLASRGLRLPLAPRYQSARREAGERPEQYEEAGRRAEELRERPAAQEGQQTGGGRTEGGPADEGGGAGTPARPRRR